MKKMLFALSALFLISGISYSTQAYEKQPLTVFTANLVKITADEQLGSNPYGGKISYDFANKTLKLEIYFAGHQCPADTQCPASVPSPLIEELPIVSIKKGSCGEKIVIAEENALPVDGALKRIKLIDNSTNYCTYVRAIPPVEGEFTESYVNRMNGDLVTLKASFEATEFIRN